MDENTLEVAHEALLREWPRLRAWLEDDAEGRRLHQHLIHAARDWQSADREPGELYRGARLASALDWFEGHEQDLNELERDFLDESRAQARHEAERQRQANRRLRVLLAGVGALLALAVVAGVVASQPARRGPRRLTRQGRPAVQRRRAQPTAPRPRPPLDPGGRAARRLPRHSGQSAVRAPAHPGGDRVVNHGWPIYGVAVSPDGRLMATGDERGIVTVYDAATRRPLGPPYRIEGAGLIQNVRFSPDGGTLAVSSMIRRTPSTTG